MAKDPAFLFYSSDFLTGTLIMPFEDRGKYITILAYMHQNGWLSEETIRLLVGSVSDNLKSKFGIDNNGLWFNSRLEEEVIKRSNFVDSRKENGKKGGRPPKKSTISLDDDLKPKDNLPEDENEIEIEDENIIDLKIKKNELTILLCEKLGYSEMRYANRQRSISDFVKVKINSIQEYEDFGLNFRSYQDYKKLSGEALLGFDGLFGKQENKFDDSKLLNENWEQKLITFKTLQPKSKFEKVADNHNAPNPYGKP